MFVRQLNLELYTLWAKDADQFIAFRREAGAAQSSPQPAMTIVYGATGTGRSAKYSFAATGELSDASAPKLATQLVRPAHGLGPSADAREAFNGLKLRLRLLLFRDRPPGWVNPTVIAADPTPVRIPTPVRLPPGLPWDSLPNWPPR